MGISFTYPKFKADDGNGVPLAGGLVWTYIPGTTTAQTTYSDYLCSVANTNPVVLDSRGEANIFFSVPTKAVLTVAGGSPSSPLWEYDYIGTTMAQVVINVGDYSGADIGAKVNAAIAAADIDRDNIIYVPPSLWCGKTYSTPIVVSKAVKLVFPGIRSSAAFYTGTTAAIKLTATGAIVSGGFSVDMTGNANANVDGLVIYGASDCLVEGGVHILNPIRYGISIDGASTGAYQNVLTGLFRVKDPGVAAIFIGTSGAAIPNANSFIGRTVLYGTTGLPAAGYGIHIDDGYENYLGHGYINNGHATSWCIYHNPGGRHNTFGTWTLDAAVLGGGVKLDTGYIQFERLYNNVAGTAESIAWGTGYLQYSGRAISYPATMSPRLFLVQNVQTAFNTTAGAGGIYGSAGGATWPHDAAGDVIIQSKSGTNAIYLCAGSGAGMGPALKIDSNKNVSKVGANQQALYLSQNTTLVASVTAGGTHTWANGIPAGAWVFGVTARVTETIAGVASFDIGDGVTQDKYGNNISTVLGTVCNTTDAATTTLSLYPTANNVVLTANGGVFTGGAGNGKVRLTVHYIVTGAEAN